MLAQAASPFLKRLTALVGAGSPKPDYACTVRHSFNSGSVPSPTPGRLSKPNSSADCHSPTANERGLPLAYRNVAAPTRILFVFVTRRSRKWVSQVVFVP